MGVRVLIRDFKGLVMATPFYLFLACGNVLHDQARVVIVSIYYRLVIGLLGFRPNILVLHILVPHTLLCLYKGNSVY